MAQSNHNASYLTVVDGITIWERLRVIRNFLQDRRIAVRLAKLNNEKQQEKIDCGLLDKWEIKEIEIYKEQTDANLKNAEDEIKFLEQLESKLAEQAELTRIQGKSDDEMYEINYFEELVQVQLLKAQSEIMSSGQISPDTMKTLLLNPRTFHSAVEVGLLPEQILQTKLPNLDVTKLGQPNFLIENKEI